MSRATRERLPSDYQDVLDFGYHSGWRKGEILRLEWRDVDRADSVIRLRPELSVEGAVPQMLPSLPKGRAAYRRLAEDLEAGLQGCGANGEVVHDLRRTVVRSLVLAGGPERVGMTVTGHKTRSVFDRYNIVSEADLKQATTRLAEYVNQQPNVLPCR